MNRLLRIGLLCGVVISLFACSATEEQTRPPEPPPSMTEVDFQSTQDTVVTDRPPSESADDPGGDRPIRYMVQIGAFSNPVNASRVQDLARVRFGIPVFNDFRTDLRLYQVRIGFFEDRESAIAFRAELMQGFPGDYDDAWIVELLP